MVATSTRTWPIYVAGEWEESGTELEVRNPFDDSLIGTTWLASAETLERATQAAVDAFQSFRFAPAFERVALLKDLAQKIRDNRDELITLLASEAGKTINDAAVEVDRGAFTVDLAAEEVKHIGGEVMPLDLLPSSKGRYGIVRRVPIGPIAGISPFNFPLNLAIHKVAPAIASGNSIVLKPPSLTPLTMLLVARLAHEVGVPAGVLSVLPMDRATGDRLVEDDRFKLLSFTGSPDVGWSMKARAGRKKVVLELGGNAGVLVDEDANLEYAAARIRTGAFSNAGQVCISVQRVFIHESRYEEMRDRIVEGAASLRMGDQLDPTTELGPMIDQRNVQRAELWVQEAVSQGARVLTGGKADGRFFQPTVIENAPKHALVCSREAFAPLVTLQPVKDFATGLRALNDSDYGLQAGVFTNRLEEALSAFDQIEAGGVILNDIPTYRIDHMPYGGVKQSGLGREGIKYTLEDMTEPRLLVVNRP